MLLASSNRLVSIRHLTIKVAVIEGSAIDGADRGQGRGPGNDIIISDKCGGLPRPRPGSGGAVEQRHHATEQGSKALKDAVSSSG